MALRVTEPSTCPANIDTNCKSGERGGVILSRYSKDQVGGYGRLCKLDWKLMDAWINPANYIIYTDHDISQTYMIILHCQTCILMLAFFILSITWQYLGKIIVFNQGLNTLWR